LNNGLIETLKLKESLLNSFEESDEKGNNWSDLLLIEEYSIDQVNLNEIRQDLFIMQNPIVPKITQIEIDRFMIKQQKK